MNMFDKMNEFYHLPMTHMQIGDKKLYFVGERNQAYHEIILSGDPSSGKFVAWYVYGNEVTGVLTVGYQNLHLYIREAFKHFLMPTAQELRANSGDYKLVVKRVLKTSELIEGDRYHMLRDPSVIKADFTREIESNDQMRARFRQNMQIEKAKI
jgi:hypothetical protein